MTRDEFKKLINRQTHMDHIEIYPNWAKDYPELREYCDERVKAGIGQWSVPIIVSSPIKLQDPNHPTNPYRRAKK